MSKFKTIALTSILTIIISAGTLNLLTAGETTNTEPFAVQSVDQKTPIDDVKMRSDGKIIYLTVFLNQPQTCAQVIALLGVGTLPLKGKIYAPFCTVIKDDYVKIIFQEQTDV